MLIIITGFSKPQLPPQKVYSVKILAAPQPETPKVKPEPEPKQEVEPEPEPVIEPEPEAQPKVETKPKEKPKEKEKPSQKKNENTQGEGHITVDGADFDNDYYLGLIYRKVYRNWITPSTASKLSATVYFQLTREGEVENARLEKRSGSPSYDRKALRTILASSPFPGLPDDYNGDMLGIHFEFTHNP